MTGAPVLICGLPLPRQIQEAIDHGTWVLPSDPAKIERVFGHAASVEAKLYAVGGMIRETEAWANAPEEELALYGGPGSGAEGGFLALDPRKSVLIGDLGYDMPIALDYSLSLERPRVVYLPPSDPGWIEVAADVPSFLDLLGVGAPR